jgi:hypothetical protein
MTAPSTPQIPDELRPYLDTIADRLLSGHAAVMVGSGFSKNATSPGSHPGFPDWSLLGDRLYERLHGNPPGPNERYLQVPALAHQVEADFGRLGVLRRHNAVRFARQLVALEPIVFPLEGLQIAEIV